MPPNLAVTSLSRRTFITMRVLRSFEKIAFCKAIRPDIAGIMGALRCCIDRP